MMEIELAQVEQPRLQETKQEEENLYNKLQELNKYL